MFDLDEVLLSLEVGLNKHETVRPLWATRSGNIEYLDQTLLRAVNAALDLFDEGSKKKAMVRGAIHQAVEGYDA